MCGGASFTDKEGKLWKIYFPNPKAALPVKQSDGSVEWVKWGKTEGRTSPRLYPGRLG